MKLRLYDEYNDPIPNRYVDHPVPVFLWIPPLLYQDYMENNKWLIWILDYESEYYTDDDGYIWIAMVIGKGKIGTYMVSFEFGTSYNMPIQFKT